MPSEVSALPALGLAEHLLVLAEVGRADSYYRLARMVARVLTGRHLKQRRKWHALARSLAAAPGVEERLVWQAMRWLEGCEVGSRLGESGYVRRVVL
jgi:hypothetical protein